MTLYQIIHHLERLTQLPTPIVKNKSTFINYTHNHSTSLQDSLSTSEPRQKSIADYKPISRSHSLKNPLTSSSSPPSKNNAFNKRIISENISISNHLQPSSSDHSTSSSILSSTTATNDSNNLQFIVSNLPNLNLIEPPIVIGHGNFSTVFLIKCANDNNTNTNDTYSEYAIKVISTPDEFITREVDILKKLHHPCTINMIDYFLDTPPPPKKDSSDNTESEDADSQKGYIMFNYCDGGSLLHFLINYQSQLSQELIFWKYIKSIIAEMILSVGYLHRNNIIHRDLKLENVLLTHRPDEIFNDSDSTSFSFPLSNLSDFGLSRILKEPNELLTTRCGSTDYVAPEVIMGLNYNGFLSDSWSLGVCIYSILENRLPFDPPPSPTTSTGSPKGSPTVMKRRRSKNTTGYRIAMIDWDWYKLDDAMIRNNDEVDDEIKLIWKQLKSIVELVLVRKERRMTILEILEKEEFKWIKECVPNFIANA
ncbi:PRR1 Serine/threonine-protein kinase PRR1 [Candida maltosa Xu316]